MFINPFNSIGFFLYPLKTKNQWFSDDFGSIDMKQRIG